MSHPLSYRFTSGEAMTEVEWDAIEAVLAARGWMALNRETTPIVLLAERGGMIVGFLPLQLVPHTEPMYVAPGERGGEVAGTLASMMANMLYASGARGWLVMAENPYVERFCRQYGMIKVDVPVYAALPLQPVAKEAEV
jgi:hypothetical protein